MGRDVLAIGADGQLTLSTSPYRVRVGGIAFFPGGVVIGKALEAHSGGRGAINVLVVPQ